MPLDTATSRRVQKQMAQELERNLRGLRLPGHPRPFFLSYLLHHLEGLDVWGRYGAVFNTEPVRGCEMYAEVRVGSYRFDQTLDGSLHADMTERESYNWLIGPKDLNANAIRYCFWKLTQLKYWEALRDYYDKKKFMVEQRLRQTAPSFSKEDRYVQNDSLLAEPFPEKRWEDFVRQASSLFLTQRGLLDPYVRIRGLTKDRIFVNSEGSKFIAQDKYFEVVVNAWVQAKDGVYLSATRKFFGRDRSELPKMSAVREAIDDLASDLHDLAKAPSMDPYAGPALLSGRSSGLFFHEAIGHRLEGERMISSSEGQTFASKIGTRILPEGVHIVDDPSLRTWEGVPLYGHYRVDDEGVPAQAATLVEDGVLKSFLLSRASVKGFLRSNGHGRHERFQDPMARMANLIITSEEKKSWEALESQLLALVRERKLSHGIIIEDVSSGETRTDQYDFQAFKGVPTRVFTIDAKTGRRRRVRDVDFIGTPLAVLQRIKSFGEDYEVDNSYCVAESGSIPVSTISPAMLVDELELQRASTKFYRPSILPPPKMKI
jgi:TldD protein